MSHYTCVSLYKCASQLQEFHDIVNFFTQISKLI